MLKVRFTILVVLATCGFSSPLDYEVDYPMDDSDKYEGYIEPQPELRTGPVDHVQLWPSAVMYYRIESLFSETNLKYIKRAIHAIEEHTCVRMVPCADEVHYVDIVNLPGEPCFSSIGMREGAQLLNLNEETCFEYGKETPLRQFLHALGILYPASAGELSQEDIHTINEIYQC